MADWLPKDPATIAEIGGALGGGGLVLKFWDHLFGWLGKSHERNKDLQAIIDDRLKILLEADEKRLAQMSGAIEGQSKEIEALREETSGLKAMIKTLIGHISSLEHILRAKRIDVPPRPEIRLSD